MELNKIWISGY